MSSSNKPGLWANIHAKRERIAKGSGEKMRRPGSEGAPTAEALVESKTASVAYAVGAEAAADLLGIVKTARSKVTHSYNYPSYGYGRYGGGYGGYGGYSGYGGYGGYGPSHSYSVEEVEPTIEELAKAQSAWHGMSPAERLALTDPKGSALAGGFTGSLLGGTLLGALPAALGLHPAAATALGLTGALGGGYLGYRGGDAAARAEARETEVPTAYSYDLARKQLARDVAAAAAQKQAAAVPSLGELRALVRGSSAAQRVGGHALTGATTGALGGMLQAEDLTDLSAIGRGALAGGLSGAALGGLGEATAHMRGLNAGNLKRYELATERQNLRQPTYVSETTSHGFGAQPSNWASPDILANQQKRMQGAERGKLEQAMALRNRAQMLTPVVGGAAGYMSPAQQEEPQQNSPYGVL